jgi:hypothetical protein
MADSCNNLLLRLHKWAWRQDENFLTESFAHLLSHLVEEEVEAGIRLLDSITGGLLELIPDEHPLVGIRTQVITAEGTPDLEIRVGTRKMALVEVKSESKARVTQFEKYRRMLRESGVPRTALVLLSRYPVSLMEAVEKPDWFVRWYQVAEWLEQERGRYVFKPTSKYLVDQFVEFLGARNMTMSQVTWDLTGGIRALRTLGDMLLEVAHACGLHATPSGNRNSLGVFLEKKAYWIRINYDRPEALHFTTYNRVIDPAKAEAAGLEGWFKWPGAETWFGWERWLNLDAEEVHFFARTKASQMQLLEGFLRECLDIVRSIELGDAKRDADDESSGN